MTSDTSSLLSELDQLLSQNNTKQPLLPSSQLLYRIGGVLSRLKTANSEPATLLQNAYQQLMLTLPQSYLFKFLETYQKALTQMMLKNGSSSSSSSADLESAVESLYGLLAHSPLACQVACCDSDDSSQQDLMISSLASIYDRFLVLESSIALSSESSSSSSSTNNNAKFSRPRAAILGCLSHLFLDGLLSLQQAQQQQQQAKKKMSSPQRPQHTINNVLERVLGFIKAMEEESTDCLGDLQEWQLQKEPLGRMLASSLQEYVIATKNNNNSSHEQNDDDDDTLQMEYLWNMLESARQKTTTTTTNHQPKGAATTTTTPATKQISAADELERRIQQVHQILPDFGQGFIETALSLFQGNVETTVATLVNDPLEYPPALRVLDRNLPRRRKERSAEQVVESLEARALVKERVALEEQQEQERYKALVYVAAQEAKANANTANTELNNNNINEYDDDYDDQYDDMDGGLGGADSGWSDMEVMKTYNQVARQEHAEDSFWEENRNTNRKSQKAAAPRQQQQDNTEGDENDDGPSGKKWGPDKIKGGRVLGPDGKVVKNQRRGGGGGKKGGNANNATAGSTTANTPQQQKAKSGPNNTNAAGDTAAGGPNKPKPKTKPKKDNRVGRQRDRKQQKQGAFGASQS